MTEFSMNVEMNLWNEWFIMSQAHPSSSAAYYLAPLNLDRFTIEGLKAEGFLWALINKTWTTSDARNSATYWLNRKSMHYLDVGCHAISPFIHTSDLE